MLRKLTERVIRTKLGPPRHSRRIVRREYLLNTLALSSERAVTLLCAPAGFGKTTLLTEWRGRLLSEGRLVAWVTLDNDDNDPAQFMRYVSRALAETLGKAAEGIPELIGVDETSSPQVVATSLINAVETIDREITLILDDYDRIVAGPIHELLSFMILHVPPQLHMLIAARSEPPLPLAHLRAHDELVEIGSAHLRFGVEHARAFFSDVAALKLSASQMRALLDATEGWVAGLQIAAIALRDRDDPDALIQQFSGNFRAVNEYLDQAVLPSIPQDMVSFLLRTSILERLSGPLCEFVAGCRDGQSLLDRLVSQNLFLQALDDEGRWYRHHALFADFLLGQLERHAPAEVRGLHLRAAEWLATHGLWSEAVRHALAANRPELAAEWVERCAMREVEDSNVRELLAWAKKLPDEMIRLKPRLRIALAWALLLTMQLDEALALIDDMSVDVAVVRSEPPERIEAELLALRFCIMALKDETVAAMPLGEKFIALARNRVSRDGEGIWRTQAVLNGMTHCYQHVGLLERARSLQQPEHYPTSADHTRNLFTHSYRACTLGACDVREGLYEEGGRKFREALAFAEAHAGRRSAAAALVAGQLAELLYYWNKIEETEEVLADRLDIIDETGYLDSVRGAYFSLVGIAKLRGDFEAANDLLDRAEVLAARRGWRRLLVLCVAERVSLKLKQMRAKEALSSLLRMQALLAESLTSQQCETFEIHRARTSATAYWLLHEEHVEEAIHLLRSAIGNEVARVDQRSLARLRLLLSLALERAGHRQEALELFGSLFDGSLEPTPVRIVADEGADAGRLVDALAKKQGWDTSSENHPHRLELLGAVGLLETDLVAAPTPASARAQMLEALSEREHAVLKLIAQGLSNKETARVLCVGTETVKWHLKNVYSKLGVSRRTLAVHRARQMNLLPASSGAGPRSRIAPLADRER